MVKRLLLAALLAFAPALAGVETTTINGKVFLPSGAAATGGTLSASLNQAGSTLDGSTQVAIQGATAGTIGGDGTVSLVVVPNDAITPSGTYYNVTIKTTGPVVSSWTEKWRVATSPDPVNIGAVTKLQVAPGITVGNYMLYVATHPTGTCTANEAPRFALDTNSFCTCQSATWACASSGAPGGVSGQVQSNVSGSFGGDAGMTYSPSNDALSLTSGNYVNCLSGGSPVACGYTTLSGVRGQHFNKSSADTGALGMSWHVDGGERWSIGMDQTATGHPYFALLWADHAYFPGGVLSSTDIFSVAPAASDTNAQDGPKWRFNAGFGAAPYDDPYQYTFYAPTKQTTGEGIYSALFLNSTDTLNSGGLAIYASRARAGLSITNPVAGWRKAYARFGQGANYWSVGQDLPAADTNSFSIYDEAAAKYRFFIDANGNIGLGGVTSPSHAVQLGQSSTTPLRFAALNTGTAADSRAGFYASAISGKAVSLDHFADTYSDAGYAGDAMLYTSGAGADLHLGVGGTKKLTISATNGFVGIGKDPATALDVNGTATATSFVGPLTGAASDVVCTNCVAAADLGANVVGPGQLDYSTGGASTNPALGAGQCAFSSSACSGVGGLVCEGASANTGEREYCLGAAGAGGTDQTFSYVASPAGTRTIATAESDQSWSGSQTFKVRDGTKYNCGFDWDGDASTTNDAGDILACLDAAKAAAGTANDGTDKAVDVYLPQGTFDLASVTTLPYALQSGMHIHGVAFRKKIMYVTGSSGPTHAPDERMTPDGGTWFVCGSQYATPLFSATRTHGIEIDNVAASDCGGFLTAGAMSEDGVAWGQFRNIFAQGPDSIKTASLTKAFECVNCQHLDGQQMGFLDYDQGFVLTSWNCNWQPTLSQFRQVFHASRAGINVVTPLNAIESKTVTGSPTCIENNPDGNNGITFEQFGISSRSDGATLPNPTALLYLNGAAASGSITRNRLLGLGVEGVADNAILLGANVVDNVFDVYSCATNTTGASCVVNTSASTDLYNVFRSSEQNLSYLGASGTETNWVSGIWRRLESGSATPKGNYLLRDDQTLVTAAIDRIKQRAYVGNITGSTAINGIDSSSSVAPTDTSNSTVFNSWSLDHSTALGTANAKSSYRGAYINPKWGGSATGNNVAEAFGVLAVPQMGSTGTSTTFSAMAPFRAGFYALGSNWSVSTFSYFDVDNVLLSPLPSGASITNLYGLHVTDLGGVGSTNTDPIRVEAQTGTGAQGNIRMAGGAYNTGHLQLGSTHLWEEAAGKFSAKNGTPASASDGVRLVTSARSSTSGPTAWAANGVSCATACGNIGVANCADSVPLDGTNTALGNCTGTTGVRVCECY